MLSRRGALGLILGNRLLPPWAGRTNDQLPRPPLKESWVDNHVAETTIIVHQHQRVQSITTGYAGFSYEKSQLRNGFFTASNQPLVRLFKRLGPSVLRLGGNSVDRINWQTSRSTRATDDVTSTDVDALATFLRATEWKALYGINFARNLPSRAAAEARFVAQSLGHHLYAFEIGNEPDAYSLNQSRTPSFSYNDFILQWNDFADAVRRAVPDAHLTGPASAWHEASWTVPFARDEGQRIILLTQHYYRANGLSPQSTLPLLLAGDPALPGLLDPLRKASRMAGIRDGYRLTEANSFYDGGAPHISNTYGSALWAIDFLFLNAAHGSSGVNFHGGGSSPGYTPIADDGQRVLQIRPEYYGILVFALMGQGTLLQTSQLVGQLAVSAYAVAGPSKTHVMIVNKEPRTTVNARIMPGVDVKSAAIMTLSGPALDSVEGITLNGAPVHTDGRWSPAPAASATIRNGSIYVQVGQASAVLVTAT
jgi:hypothetical protein